MVPLPRQPLRSDATKSAEPLSRGTRTGADGMRSPVEGRQRRLHPRECERTRSKGAISASRLAVAVRAPVLSRGQRTLE